MIDGFVDLLIDWLTEGLIDWLNDWLIGWMIDWLIDWLNDWLIDWLVHWLIGSFIDWFIHWLIDLVVKTLYEKIQDEECQIADAATMIFSNLTRQVATINIDKYSLNNIWLNKYNFFNFYILFRDLVSCSAVWDSLQENNIEIERLVFLLCQVSIGRV